MSKPFDPYYEWLAIPPQDQPPNLYRLLGLQPLETDLELIASAAEQRLRHVRSFERSKYANQSQEVLNKLFIARACLLSPTAKARYDAELVRDMSAKGARFPSPPLFPAPSNSFPAATLLGQAMPSPDSHCISDSLEFEYEPPAEETEDSVDPGAFGSTRHHASTPFQQLDVWWAQLTPDSVYALMEGNLRKGAARGPVAFHWTFLASLADVRQTAFPRALQGAFAILVLLGLTLGAFFLWPLLSSGDKPARVVIDRPKPAHDASPAPPPPSPQKPTPPKKEQPKPQPAVAESPPPITQAEQGKLDRWKEELAAWTPPMRPASETDPRAAREQLRGQFQQLRDREAKLAALREEMEQAAAGWSEQARNAMTSHRNTLEKQISDVRERMHVVREDLWQGAPTFTSLPTRQPGERGSLASLPLTDADKLQLKLLGGDAMAPGGFHYTLAPLKVGPNVGERRWQVSYQADATPAEPFAEISLQKEELVFEWLPASTTGSAATLDNMILQLESEAGRRRLQLRVPSQHELPLDLNQKVSAQVVAAHWTAELDNYPLGSKVSFWLRRTDEPIPDLPVDFRGTGPFPSAKAIIKDQGLVLLPETARLSGRMFLEFGEPSTATKRRQVTASLLLVHGLRSQARLLADHENELRLTRTERDNRNKNLNESREKVAEIKRKLNQLPPDDSKKNERMKLKGELNQAEAVVAQREAEFTRVNSELQPLEAIDNRLSQLRKSVIRGQLVARFTEDNHEYDVVLMEFTLRGDQAPPDASSKPSDHPFRVNRLPLPTDIRIRIAARVRALRQSAGPTQEAFADKCGSDRIYIS